MRDVTTRFVQRAAEQDWCAVVDDDGQWLARQLVAEATTLAGVLRSRGRPRPTVLVQSENSHRLMVAGLAVGLVDGTLALASSHSSADDIAATIEAIRPDAIVGDRIQLEKWGLAVGEEIGGGLAGWTVLAADGIADPHRWGAGVVIGMTSGSTGRSKGVVHTEASMHYASANEIAAAGLVTGDAVGVIVPLSAAPAFAFGVYLSLQLKSTAVLSARWNPADALEQLASHDVRWLMCVPTQVLQLAAAAEGRTGLLSGMKAITVGGGPMELAGLSAAEQRLGVRILRVFGMSECLGHTTPALDDPPEIRLGRDGRPFPGTDVRILDDAGNELGFRTVGRAQVRGPSLFLGYADQGRLQPPALTPDGFFETGDLLARHPDGTIEVSGRIKDVIIRGGRNISIAEVETALLGDPRIADACVTAVPDELLGERVAALVVSTDPGLTLESVCAALDARGVAKIKWPEYLVAVDTLPRTHVGKVSRQLAREFAVRRIAGDRNVSAEEANQ